MTECDEVRTMLLSGRALDAGSASHLAACPRCSAEQAAVRALAAYAVPAPPSPAGVLAAAAPLLALRARRAGWRALGRAVAAALVPLPLVLLVDVYLVRAAYGMLQTLLPRVLSFYVVFNYAATLTLLLAITYAMVPIVAERQLRLRREESRA